jgi:hypothetical protein
MAQILRRGLRFPFAAALRLVSDTAAVREGGRGMPHAKAAKEAKAHGPNRSEGFAPGWTRFQFTAVLPRDHLWKAPLGKSLHEMR